MLKLQFLVKVLSQANQGLLYGFLGFPLYLLVSSADNFCKQFGSNLFDTLIVFQKEIFEKDDFKKISRRQKAGKISQEAKTWVKVQNFQRPEL